MEARTTQEETSAAKVVSNVLYLAERVAAVHPPTIQAPTSVVAAESTTSLTARIPVAADLISIDPPRTAAVTVADITAITTFVAVDSFPGKVTAAIRAAVEHPATTARAMSAATVSVDRSPTVFIPVAVEPPATITGIIPAATIAGFTPCSAEHTANYTHPAAEVGSTTPVPTAAAMEGP